MASIYTPVDLSYKPLCEKLHELCAESANFCFDAQEKVFNADTKKVVFQKLGEVYLCRDKIKEFRSQLAPRPENEAENPDLFYIHLGVDTALDQVDRVQKYVNGRLREIH